MMGTAWSGGERRLDNACTRIFFLLRCRLCRWEKQNNTKNNTKVVETFVSATIHVVVTAVVVGIALVLVKVQYS